MNNPERQFSAAAERNRQPMLDVLRRVLPVPARRPGRALEIASGSGQHVAFFSAHLPGWQWQPTDYAARVLPSIVAWAGAQPDADAEPAANVLPPLRLDVCDDPWPIEGSFDAMLCMNMLHIAPWACCAGLMRGAARQLGADGVLVTYGPYLFDDEPNAEGNLAFDAELRQRDPAWGVRRLADVVAEARAAGLRLRERIGMPSNNLSLVFEHAGAPANEPGRP